VVDSIPILQEAEAEKMISEEEIKRRALHAVEQVAGFPPSLP